MQILRFGLFLFVVAFACAVSANDETQIDHGCHGNALEACYLHINGPITTQAVENAVGMLEDGVETFKVLLNSKGGDLSAGIALGRAIRSAGMQTNIGVYQERDFPLHGECLSACAYAFLGGTQRFVRERDRIGFHQFVVSGIPRLEGTGGLIVGQKLSASVIAYMVEMGVDARLFAVASETGSSEMYFPSQTERAEYDIETPVGFDHFFMEPYGKGVVAGSKRLGPTQPYDRVDHLTAYCRDGRARVLLTISGADQYVPDIENGVVEIAVARAGSTADDRWVGVTPRRSDVRTWGTDSGAYIEIAFDASLVPIDENAVSFRAYLFTSRAAGGAYQAVVELNDMDRRMLRAAFEMCI